MYHKKPQNIEAWCSHCPIQEQVRALKKRIESDKNHLQELESQLKESNGMKGTDSGANWEVHLRDNPTFQHRFDAMDSYLGPPRSGLSASKPESKQSKRAKTLFKECQKRINAAEALLEQANSEQSVRQEIAALRECVTICLEDIKERQEADQRLSDILYNHLQYL